MNFQAILTNLYFILIYADGKLNEKEMKLSEKMILAEKLDREAFKAQLELLKSSDLQVVYNNTIIHLKKLKAIDQTRIVAWLCMVANIDGFMDKAEWMFIYKIYAKELNLKLDDVMKVQRDLILLTQKQADLLA